MRKKNIILVVAVHPDDETLGCGGTLLRHVEEKDEIHWLICTTMDKKNLNFKKRLNQINKVAKLYGFKSVNNLLLKTTKVDQYSTYAIVKKISKIINKIKPNQIYLPFKSDIHSDHKKIFEACYTCTKSFRYPFIKKIFMMETLSETEFALNFKKEVFAPNVFVNITKYLTKKIEIMNIYKSEISNHPFPRSQKNIKALATFRGATCGYKYAESFMLLKEIL